jgi:hypothetical protein
MSYLDEFSPNSMWKNSVSVQHAVVTIHRAIVPLNRQQDAQKGPSSKAAASEEARRTLRYVEPLREARTMLADFFSILPSNRRNGIETECASLEPGHTNDVAPRHEHHLLLPRNRRRRVPDSVRTFMIEPNASMVKNITHDILPRIMDHYMILGTLPHPARSSIAALRTFFGIAILAGSCTLPITSLIFAPELFDQGAVIRAKVDEQLTAATGILGAIAGYLFGKATKGPDVGQKPNTTDTQ